MAKYYGGITVFDNIRVALLDFYGAYNVSTNPTGVDVKASTTAYLVFTCTAISDKVIKITGISDLITYYGDAWTSADVITNPVCFGGSTTGGSTTSINIVCATNTLVIDVLVSTILSRILIIGKLSNNAYALWGSMGNTSYSGGAGGFLTADNTSFKLSGLEGTCNAGAKAFKAPLILTTVSGSLHTTGTPITWADVFSVTRALGVSPTKSGAYYITTSDHYDLNSVFLKNSLIVEGITN